jgi:type IV secretion system protein VirB11
VQECSPAERLVTIEDAREIFLPNHPNRVHLLYSKNGQGVAQVTAQMLLVSCLRMKPDRILLAEVREGECYDFLRTAASGHPGSITSLHAGTCAEAFEQMGLMIRQSVAGAGLSHSETQRLLRLLVDVVVQYKKDHRGRRVSEIYYRPLRKKELTA